MGDDRGLVEVQTNSGARLFVATRGASNVEGTAPLSPPGPPSSGPSDIRSKPTEKLVELLGAVGEATDDLVTVLGRAKPDAMRIEFGVEIVAKSGQLLAALVDAGGTASFKVTLEWGSPAAP